MMSSLRMNLMPSASGCNSPCGPTRYGPQRAWMWATTLRSSHVNVGNAGQQDEENQRNLHRAAMTRKARSEDMPMRFLGFVHGIQRPTNRLTVPEVKSESFDENTRSWLASAGGFPAGCVCTARPTSKFGRAIA